MVSLLFYQFWCVISLYEIEDIHYYWLFFRRYGVQGTNPLQKYPATCSKYVLFAEVLAVVVVHLVLSDLHRYNSRQVGQNRYALADMLLVINTELLIQ